MNKNRLVLSPEKVTLREQRLRTVFNTRTRVKLSRLYAALLCEANFEWKERESKREREKREREAGCAGGRRCCYPHGMLMLQSVGESLF